ncbi:MAG: manganese efflux pump MntP family protein [Candidatus Dormibacteraceae bacterium]
MLRLIALVLPLGLDTFAVAAAIGMIGLRPGQRVRLGLLFASFEAGMPLIGLGLGFALGHLLGGYADYLAIAALAGLGAVMLVGSGRGDEQRIQQLVDSRGIAMIGLGISISLDELAIGFTLGLVHVPVAAAVFLIALQAFAVSQLGFQIGDRIGEALREGVERAAGIVLMALAAVLLVARLVPLPI